MTTQTHHSPMRTSEAPAAEFTWWRVLMAEWFFTLFIIPLTIVGTGWVIRTMAENNLYAMAFMAVAGPLIVFMMWNIAKRTLFLQRLESRHITADMPKTPTVPSASLTEDIKRRHFELSYYVSVGLEQEFDLAVKHAKAGIGFWYPSLDVLNQRILAFDRELELMKYKPRTKAHNKAVKRLNMTVCPPH